MKIGYARVSTLDQSLQRQTDQLKNVGCQKIYKEKVTGTKKDRPEFNKMLEYAREGDTIVITELTRLSRSTKDLIAISETLEQKKVELLSLKENIDTKTATGKAMFGMLAVIAQFERDLIVERTKEGLASARARGRKGGRPKIDPKDIERALMLYDMETVSVSDICKMCGISKMTLYRRLEERKKGQVDLQK